MLAVQIKVINFFVDNLFRHALYMKMMDEIETRMA